MKTRPYIELSERDTILRQLRRRGNWTTVRNGARVRFWTRRYPEAVRVCYQIFPRKTVSVHGVAPTVGKAIEASNEVLLQVPRPVLIPAPPAVYNLKVISKMPPAPADPWLPYKDSIDDVELEGI